MKHWRLFHCSYIQRTVQFNSLVVGLLFIVVFFFFSFGTLKKLFQSNEIIKQIYFFLWNFCICLVFFKKYIYVYMLWGYGYYFKRPKRLNVTVSLTIWRIKNGHFYILNLSLLSFFRIDILGLQHLFYMDSFLKFQFKINARHW